MTDAHKFLTIALGDMQRAQANLRACLAEDGVGDGLTSLDDAVRRIGGIVEIMDEQAQDAWRDRQAYEQSLQRLYCGGHLTAGE